MSAMRTENEVALGESEEKYRRLFDRNPVPMWVFDIETLRFLEVNDAALRQYGYRRDEFLSMTITDIRPREEVPALRQRLCQRRPGPDSGLWKHQTKDGSLLFVEVKADDIVFGGRAARLVSAVDVGDRERTGEALRLSEQKNLRLAAEGALNQSEERFRLLVENVKDYAIFLLDPQGKVSSWNAGAQRLKGYAGEEIIGLHFSKFYPPEDIAAGKPQRALKIAAAEGRYEDEGLRVRKDGSRFWANVVITALRDAQGDLRGFGKVTRDVTERKCIHENLKKAKEAAEASNRELEAFSYSIAHDLRAPLRSMDGFSQALLEDCSDKLDETDADHLRRIRAASQKMAALIEGLLNLSRLARVGLDLQRVDLSAMARTVIADLELAHPGRKVQATVGEALEAQGDPLLLRIVLQNLLANAWKFTSRSKDAAVEFGATTHDGESAFFVRDNGAGFDMAYAEKLFGVFQRLHHPTQFEGTGVGLATVSRIIGRHGGKVWAKAQVDQGATFFFTLPAATGGIQ